MHAACAPEPARHWSTEAEADPARRLDYWVGAICEAFLEMDCTSRETARFGGDLLSQSQGALNLNRVRAASQEVFRTPQSIRRSVRAPFYLIMDAQNDWCVEQDGQGARLRPGDAVLVDSARPYALRFTQGVSCLSIQIPREWLGQWLRVPETKGLRCTRRDQGWGRSLAALAHQLVDDLPAARAWPQQMLAEHIGALVAAALEPADHMAARAAHGHAALAARLRQHLELHFASPGLTAARVAQALGVSARTLHRALQGEGTGFVQLLQQRRVAQAARMLRQPRLAALQAGEIGRRCGFADPSHFNRVFQAHQGMTPQQWRGLPQADGAGGTGGAFAP